MRTVALNTAVATAIYLLVVTLWQGGAADGPADGAAGGAAMVGNLFGALAFAMAYGAVQVAMVLFRGR